MKNVIKVLFALVAIMATATAATIEITAIKQIEEDVLIKNTGEDAINLAGWTLSDEKNHSFVFPDYSLESGEILTVNSKVGNNTDSIIYMQKTGRGIWNNDHDVATLYNENGEVMATKKY